jgi:murein L,D-transpeptidase YcbB/YkuD
MPVVMPADSSHIAYSGLNWPKQVFDFYKSRDCKAYWFAASGDDAGLVDSLRGVLNGIHYLGLLPDNYHSETLAFPHQDSVRLEALLTDSFLSLAHAIKFGSPVVAGNDSANVEALDKIKNGSELVRYLRTLEPLFIGYHELKNALRCLLDSAGLFPGSDVSLQQKIYSANVNMNRWRHLSSQTQTRYLLVNIPAYMLYLVDNDSIVMQSKIIVGKPESPTPELFGTVDRITINPYWYVPRKIAVEEYLPLLQTDPAFLSTNNFDVLDRKGNLLAPDSIDWKVLTPHTFRVVLRQQTGRENSLGLFKFVFDNPFAVYLHDTNAKKLFKKTMRSFSHGCVRVERAEELAHYLVTGSPLVRSRKIKAAVASGQIQTIRLSQPVIIYITYFTAAGKDGKFIQYDDLYQCDSNSDQ